MLPSVPLSVDPDGWLHGWDGWEVRRLVSAQGSVKVDVDRYDVSTKLAGQWVTVHLDAHERYGFSYIPVYGGAQMENFAPVVAQLAGT